MHFYLSAETLSIKICFTKITMFSKLLIFIGLLYAKESFFEEDEFYFNVRIDDEFISISSEG